MNHKTGAFIFSLNVSCVKKYQLFIDGHFKEGKNKESFPDIDPATGKTIAEVSLASDKDVDQAVQSAKQSLKGPWGKMQIQNRLDLLRKIGDRIQERFQDFLNAEISDTGKPITLAQKIDIPRGAANFKIFADLARNLPAEIYETQTEDGSRALNYESRVPLGVVAIISPWNLPFLLLTWKVAPALACGNAVVVKPSSETPGTATLLAEIMNEVGVPPGVYNVIHGQGSTVGEVLIQHPEISGITFTGESGTGAKIMEKAAPNLKKLSFELGGKNPAIIFADSDFEKAVEGTARSVFMNTGQVCLCTERVYVERKIFEKFIESLKQKAEELKPGDPFNVKTTLGPLISEKQREKVLSYYKMAVEEGSEVITGGGIPDLPPPFHQGAFVEPTIWIGLKETARVIKEEIFGPVCHIQPFDSEEEAVAMANNSSYGLAAAVWTNDLNKAHYISSQLETGITWVNSWYLRDLRTPFGGMKKSGIGREGGKYSLQFYSEIRNICIKLSMEY